MPSLSSIESHPQKDKIINAILTGQPYRDIEAWTVPTVTRGSLSRFKQHSLDNVRASVAAAKSAIAIMGNDLDANVTSSVTKAALIAAADPFTLRALKSDARRERWMDAIEADPDGADYRALSGLDRNDLTAQEYQARLAGRLDAPSQGSSTTFVLMPLMQVQAPAVPNADAVDVAFTSEPGEPAK